MQMADLARLAGVSTSTVSRALSGSALINEETRERIQALARQFNYTINSVATNLRSGVKRTIAVVVPYEMASRQSFADPFLHGIIGSLADALTERGYEMLLSRMDADRLDMAAALIDGGRAAGLILIGQWRHHDQLNAMAERGLPMVVWGARLPHQNYCIVGGDNVLGGRLVAEHLLAQGRRRMVFLGDAGLPEVAQRYRGFAQCLRKNVLPLLEQQRAAASFLADSGRKAMLALIDANPTLDAVFASSDLLAMAAIGALRERGRRIPADVAVVGYDDVELAAYFNPPITTVRQPIHEAGGRLVETLLSLIKGQSLPVSAPLETQLIVRESSQAKAAY
ncbi:LacI family DNA-binding transcriptional regulator [Rhodanobacter sp. MP1X3]|uniref:LacI family DNA-binding transcriptional regulator n=1 Tax=Rhodanobacter sp. MP1X3 TaxID=2723086 RepID=UPI0017C7C061|nr:LacI family DNA-binding transcriptional regulator [Rhodanobacter sp. MP1X3]MBB6241690.1 DNA-binding LacI/PurR family transcriptional regulator [Rhodanobacter sp. MP1X3]